MIYDTDYCLLVGLRFADREGMSFLEVGGVDKHTTVPKLYHARWINLF